MEINLKRTGDFWIDLGIISLWTRLASQASKRGLSYVAQVKKHGRYGKDIPVLKIVLSPDQLSLISEKENVIVEELDKICEKLYCDYVGKASTGRNWWQGISNFFFKNTKPESFFKSPEGMVKEQKGKWSKETCNFCGLERMVKDLGTTEHPLVVTSKKFQSFYSELSSSVKICNYCTFVTKFVPTKLFFNRGGNAILTMIFESSDLITLNNLYVELSRLFAEANEYGNFPNVISWTRYPAETFMNFLCAIKTETTKSNILKNTLEKLENSKAHVIKGTLGQGLIIDNYIIIPNLFKTYNFIEHCDWKSKSGKKYNALINTLKFLMVKTSTGMDTTKREEFCHRIFYNYDVTNLLFEFLIDNTLGKSRTGNLTSAGFSGFNIEVFITKYEKILAYMNQCQIDMSKKIGAMIGDLAKKTGNKSLLYSLRSARNLNDLLAFINEILNSYLDMIVLDRNHIDDLLKAIDNSNWSTYKSLIGIHAVLSFLENNELVEVKSR